jgi:hypothetical protein
MISSKSSSIEKLSRLISSETSGIIWLTDEALNNDLDGIYEFNYLTNGLLTKSIQNHQDKKDIYNFFITKNFDSPFFLSHISSAPDQKHNLRKICNQLEVAKPIIKESGCIVYVYNKSAKTDGIKLLKELSKRYTELKFIALTL